MTVSMLTTMLSEVMTGWAERNDLLTQIDTLADLVDEGHKEVHAGGQRPMVFAQPLNDLRFTLGDDADGAEECRADEEDDDKEEDPEDYLARFKILHGSLPRFDDGVRAIDTCDGDDRALRDGGAECPC